MSSYVISLFLDAKKIASRLDEMRRKIITMKQREEDDTFGEVGERHIGHENSISRNKSNKYKKL